MVGLHPGVRVRQVRQGVPVEVGVAVCRVVYGVRVHQPAGLGRHPVSRQLGSQPRRLSLPRMHPNRYRQGQ